MDTEKNLIHRLKEALHHMLVYGLGSVANSLIGFLLVPILTNRLSTEEFGVFSLLQMSGVIASSIFYLGITSALPRSYFDYDSESDRKKVFSTSFYLVTFGALIQLILGFFLKEHLAITLTNDIQYKWHIFIILSSSALGFITQIFYTLLRFKRKSKTVAFWSLFAAAANISFVFFFLSYLKMGIMAPLLAYLFSNIILFVILFISCRKDIVFSFLTSEAKIQLKFGLPTILTSFAVMSIELADRLFIKEYLSIKDVGQYSVGYKMGSIINILLLLPFAQIWNPMMMEYRKDPTTDALFTKITTYYYAAGALIVIISTLFLNDFLLLFIPSKDYSNGLMISPIIMYGLCIYGLTNIVSAGLIYSRNIFKITLVYYITALINILLNFLWIKPFGYVGASWSSFITYTITPLLVYFFAKKYFVITYEIKKLLLITIFTLSIVIGNFYLQQQNQHLSIPLKMTTLLILALFGYFLILGKKEKIHFKKLLNKLPNLF